MKPIEYEFSDLIRKYRTKMDSGEIAECIIGHMVCLCGVKAMRTGELEYLEDDLIGIVKANIIKVKKHMEEKQ